MGKAQEEHVAVEDPQVAQLGNRLQEEEHVERLRVNNGEVIVAIPRAGPCEVCVGADTGSEEMRLLAQASVAAAVEGNDVVAPHEAGIVHDKSQAAQKHGQIHLIDQRDACGVGRHACGRRCHRPSHRTDDLLLP